ncbi:MAG: lipoyl(octanoyl) transferase [Syntrophus sp. SKADARSKE-3]|nr:lipoyl(octanoyl) transferase [Syntrophus sp. SKADARSKE-3]
MAIDEAIFRETLRVSAPPTLRFYGWIRPSVSLGYFQNIEHEIDGPVCLREGIDVVFRPTGGKAVYHDDDITYAVVAGKDDQHFPDDIMGTYRTISRCLAAGLAKLGVDARLADKGRQDDPKRLMASCFSLPSRFELLVDGKKICGSAQVRSRGGFLQHGSLLMTFDPARTYDVLFPHPEPREEHVRRLSRSVTSLSEHLALDSDIHRQVCNALKDAFTDQLHITLVEGALTPEEEDLKANLLRTKYCREHLCTAMK